MATDYRAIRVENKRRYGTDISEIGPMLLANRYADRTHFIFELLQNAEDALGHHSVSQTSRSVSFILEQEKVSVSHFGKPFDRADVRGVCGIGKSTKDLTAIGRFGIGFKSVYAFTSRPEIHSGSEHFAIESFVKPHAVRSMDLAPGETRIVIPFRDDDDNALSEVATCLADLRPSTILFLRQIENLEWRVEGGDSGAFRRTSTAIDELVRVVGLRNETGREVGEESWLVFSKPVTSDGGKSAGSVEIAFALENSDNADDWMLRPVAESSLVAFFPTILETHLGFLVQGPYRTTPSRDNVPSSENWNRSLVSLTATLVVEGLRWLRDRQLLNARALCCLPIDASKFTEESMFAPVFEATRRALLAEDLLPTHEAGYVAAPHARLSRSHESRELFDRAQLSSLLQVRGDLSWLDGDITQDRTPDLRKYLVQVLSIPELTTDALIRLLDARFLAAQADGWIVRLYEFLNGQPALWPKLEDVPLLRLLDGQHVKPKVDGQPQAFLPGRLPSGFPTLKPSVCTSPKALHFLESIGLALPDPVDDVIRNILPHYKEDATFDDSRYESDIKLIQIAFRTDSQAKRGKLIEALRQSLFIKAVDAGDGSTWWASPGEVYMSTARLKDLFEGVKGVLLVDDRLPFLKGEAIRPLLEACGVSRSLLPTSIQTSLSWQELAQIRREAGLARSSWQSPILDTTLYGLIDLLQVISEFDPARRRARSALLWEALAELESHRGSRVFVGEYKWGYSHEVMVARFDMEFVRTLRSTAWVPDTSGELQRPEFVLFEDLDWQPSPFLQSLLRFRAPIIDSLAKAVGIEPGALKLLKELGVTSEADLRARLGFAEVFDADDSAAASPQGYQLSGDQSASHETLSGVTQPLESGNDRAVGGDEDGTANRTSDSGHGTFISYVAVDSVERVGDPDGLDHETRLALEEKAIDLIVSREPAWQRTRTNNPGYDLCQTAENGEVVLWCEVKAMKGSLSNRPVGVSRRQFLWAQERGESYWLYIVERADTPEARVVRIQDPAGKAKTFSFDQGWLDAAV